MWELRSAWVRNPRVISDCFLQVMMVPRHCWGRHLRLPPKGGQKYWNWSPEILRFIAHILNTPNPPLLSNGVRDIEIYGKRDLSPFHYIPSFQWVRPNEVRIIEIYGKHPLLGLRHLARNWIFAATLLLALHYRMYVHLAVPQNWFFSYKTKTIVASFGVYNSFHSSLLCPKLAILLSSGWG